MKVFQQRAWVFESSGSAYNASQCDEEIRTGDILLVPKEKLVGLADTWPVAVTELHGDLHYVLDLDETYPRFPAGAVEGAVQLALDLGWEVAAGSNKRKE